MDVVFYWLSGLSTAWTLILDNVDEPSLLSHVCASGRALRDYIPSTSQGTIIVTSGSRAVCNRIGAICLSVEPMTEEDSLTLLKSKTEIQNEADARVLLQELEYLPLAITQAGAYISGRAPRWSVSTYLNAFRIEANRMKLLEHPSLLNHQDIHSAKTIMATWQISFDRIRQETPSATEVLALMSMFDHSLIPEDLVHPRNGLDLDFEDDVATLQSYSLITFIQDSNSFKIHRLIRLSMVTWLDKRNELAYWRELALTNLLSLMRGLDDKQNWVRCKRFLAHAETVIAQYENQTIGRDLAEKKLNPVVLVVAYRMHSGNTHGQEILCKKAIDESRQLSAAPNPLTSRLMGAYSLLLARNGSYDQAIINQEQLIAEPGQVLDTNSRLMSELELMAVLLRAGKLSRLESMARRVASEHNDLLGLTHERTLSAMSYLAQAISSQGKKKEALKLSNFVIDLIIAGHDEANLGLPIYITRAASIYLDLGNYIMAEKLLKDALKKFDLLQETESDHAVGTQVQYGRVLAIQGSYAAAERTYRKVLEARQHMLGPKHPEVLIITNNLMGVIAHTRLEEAISMTEQLFIVEQEVLGANHPITQATATRLARDYLSGGRFEKAETLFRRVIEHAKQIQNVEIPGFKFSLFDVTADLMWCLTYQCRWVEAEAETVKLLIYAKVSCSKEMQKVCYELLLVSLPPQRRLKEMMPFFKIWTKLCQGSELQFEQQRMAMCLIELGKYAEAEALLKDIGPQLSDLDGLLTFQLLKSILQAQDKSADSLNLEILAIWNKLGSTGCPLDMFLVTTSIWAGQLDEAEDHLRQVLYNSKHHEVIFSVAERLYLVLKTQGRIKKSRIVEMAVLMMMGGTKMGGSC